MQMGNHFNKLEVGYDVNLFQLLVSHIRDQSVHLFGKDLDIELLDFDIGGEDVCGGAAGGIQSRAVLVGGCQDGCGRGFALDGGGKGRQLLEVLFDAFVHDPDHAVDVVVAGDLVDQGGVGDYGEEELVAVVRVLLDQVVHGFGEFTGVGAHVID